MPTEIIPVAIYTRKSNDAQLEKEIHSLSVQRNSAEHYITSQSHLGWCLIDEYFDDNNVSGATLERPALQRLKTQIEAGKIKVVVVNRLDRISRSLSQFIELTKYFKAHGVALVSSTQDFNSGDATGDLMRHILLSFAEFEHELIRERATERLHTARKEGCFTGAQPMLGYNISPYSGKLVIDTEEATQVRQIYELYLKLKSVRGTAKKLKQMGWHNKQWLTKQEKTKGGGPFSANGLHKLLTNQIYIGRVKIQDNTFDGKHQAIIDHDLFEAVQDTLKQNRRGENITRRKQQSPLLHNLLYCPFCSARCVHHTTTRRNRTYRYYSCGNQRTNGTSACDAPTTQAGKIEHLVIEQLQTVGYDSDHQDKLIEQIQTQESGKNSSLPSTDQLRTVLKKMNHSLTLYQQYELVRALLNRVEFNSIDGKITLHFNEDEIIRRASSSPS
jgi:site-specific DNA recombinase|tara:strand:- start:519 stop:1850 length:1332 start_codon:yes stop_codon:yes gene_type:complete